MQMNRYRKGFGELNTSGIPTAQMIYRIVAFVSVKESNNFSTTEESENFQPPPSVIYIFKVDRLQVIVVAKNITVLQLFISRMPKMCAIPQLVSAPSNPIATVEHLRRSHPQFEHNYGQHKIMQSKIKTLSNELNTHVN